MEENQKLSAELHDKVFELKRLESQQEKVVLFLKHQIVNLPLFLRFVSGRSRLPDKVKVQSMDSQTALPTAATCFYSMCWPQYPDVEVATEKLRYAIYDAQTIDTDGSRSGESFALD